MHIVCNKDILINNINIVLKSVANKTTMPILECILLIADKDGFRLLSNDLELAIETANIKEADVIEKGMVALDAKLFSDIIKNMPEEEITINVLENNQAIIKSGKIEYKVLGQNGSEFPMINLIEKDTNIKINCLQFKNMIKQTKFSISLDESKPILTGELLEIKEKAFNIVAIDGFRVSFRTTSIDTDTNIDAVVPAKALNEIIKILPEREDAYLNIYFDEKSVMLELESCIIISRLLEGEFLKYEQIFTNEFKTKIEINKNNFLSSLERASIISRDNKKNPVKLEIKENILEITSNTEFSDFSEELKIDLEGEDLKIAFNPRYLIEALKAIEDEVVYIEFMSSLSPCIIKSINHDNYKYLILPLKIN